MSAIENAALGLIGYLVVIFPCIFAFVIMFKNTFGAYMNEYSSIENSILNFFLNCVGRGLPVMMIRLNKVWGVIYVLLIYLFAIHFVIVIYGAVSTAAFRDLLDAYGNPLDERASKRWKLKQLFLWSLSFLPNTCLVKMGLKDSLAPPRKIEEPVDTKTPIQSSATPQGLPAPPPSQSAPPA